MPTQLFGTTPAELLAPGTALSTPPSSPLTSASPAPALVVAWGEALPLADAAVVTPPLEVALPLVLVASVLGPPDTVALAVAPGIAPLVDAVVADVPPPPADSVAEAVGAITPLLDSAPLGMELPLGAVVQAVEVNTLMSTMECFIVID